MWRTLKLFPHCFGVVPSEEALTDSQWIWVQCHLLLDDGAQACPQCDALGIGRYCHACGARVAPEPVECPACHQMGSGRFCTFCGETMQSSVAEAIAAGNFDWDEWLTNLQPFLGGLTLREQQVMMRDTMRYGSSVDNGVRR